MYWTTLFLFAPIVKALITEPEKQEMLSTHNLYRCIHQVPQFTWDMGVAASAQSWADQGVFAHSANADRPGCGENLATGTPTMSAEQAARMWYAEIQHTAPYGRTSGFSSELGHYTQMVWKASVEVGCGKGQATGGGDLWVCRYCPAGNTVGRFDENVLPPTKSVASCGGSETAVPSGFAVQPGAPAAAPAVAPASVDAAGLAVAPAPAAVPVAAVNGAAGGGVLLGQAGGGVLLGQAGGGVLPGQGARLAGNGVLPAGDMVLPGHVVPLAVTPAVAVAPVASMPVNVGVANGLAVQKVKMGGLLNNYEQEGEVPSWASTWSLAGTTMIALALVVFVVGMTHRRAQSVLVPLEEPLDEELSLNEF